MDKKLLLENESTEDFRNNKLVHSEDALDPDEVAFSSKSTKGNSTKGDLGAIRRSL